MTDSALHGDTIMSSRVRFARLLTATGRQLRWLVPALLVLAAAAPVRAQDNKTSMEVYGFAMLDIGHNFDSIAPNWSDTMRVTRLPSFAGEYGGPHHFRRRPAVAVRRQRPCRLRLGELKTTFEFELFGTGVDEGQTTFRLRHAYGELGAFGAGQTWSPFMDTDVFPNSLEYWGPTGMAFYPERRSSAGCRSGVTTER